MTIVRSKIAYLKSLLSKDVPETLILRALEDIGTDPSIEGDELVVEVYPNRPDMYSPEGIARALRAYLEISKGLPIFNVRNGELEVYVDSSVRNVRPYIAGAVIRNVRLSDEALESIMRLQEALHESYGRKRRKVAIGIHDLDKVTPPFKYTTVDPQGIKFVPLNFEEALTPKEILELHPKGQEYGHIIKDFERYPIILDAENNVLSMPPIINGELTRVTENTKNIFVDVTGTHLDSVIGAVNIVTASLLEHAEYAETVKIVYPDRTLYTPELSNKEITVKREDVKKVLGFEMSDDEMVRSLEKMMYGIKKITPEEITVIYPSIRRDILHPIDVIEDIAIGFGYENVNEELPHEYSEGTPDALLEEIEEIRDIMTGLGFLEVVTFNLSSEESEFELMRMSKGPTVRILNPISREMNVVRRSLLPSLLRILAHNKDEELPIMLFEVGEIVKENYQNTYNLAFVIMDTKEATFTNMRRYVEAFLRYYCGDCGSLRMKDDPRYIPGRSAEILINNISVGIFGEIHPQILENFDLPYPVVAAEINVEEAFKALRSLP